MELPRRSVPYNAAPQAAIATRGGTD